MSNEKTAANDSTASATPGTAPGRGSGISMHEGVEVWCDCCSCEAEPYWIEAMQGPNADDD